MLCDGECRRAYHLSCLRPALTIADLPEGDEGWLCPSCDAKVDALWAINNAFGWSWPLDTPWNVFFLDEAEEGAQAAHGGAATAQEEPDWPSEDSQDEDFHPNEPPAEALSDGQGTEGRAERDGDEDEDGDTSSDEDADDEQPRAAPARRTRAALAAVGGGACASLGSDEGSDSEDSSSSEEAVVLEGKRRRTAVDYVALNGEMFGTAEPGFMSDEDAAWEARSLGGASSLASPLASPLAAPTGAGSNGTMAFGCKPSKAPASRCGGRSFPANVTAALRCVFEAQPLPSRGVKEALVQRTGLTLQQVNFWFSNNRQKAKRAAAQARQCGGADRADSSEEMEEKDAPGTEGLISPIRPDGLRAQAGTASRPLPDEADDGDYIEPPLEPSDDEVTTSEDSDGDEEQGDDAAMAARTQAAPRRRSGSGGAK